MTTEAGKQLSEKLDWNAETALILSNASHRNFRQLLVKHAESQAGINELWQANATQEEAWAQTVTQLYSSIDNAENTFNSEIKEVKTSISKLDQAFGQTTTEIRTEITTTNSATNQRIDSTNNNLAGTNKNLGITNQNLDKTNQNLDKTNRSLQLTDEEVVRVAADVVTNKEAISKTNQAMAKSEEQVQAQFGKQQGMINQKMQAEFSQTGDGVVTHSINITIVHNNVKYNAAGQVISAQVKNGKLESFFGYNANNFAWYNPANGKMELFMHAKNGQFFIKEAFLDKANVREMVLSEAIKSKNYELGKTGFIIDANTGNAEFNNATFRGTIDGADGKFTGTVYAERLIGDVSTGYVMKGSSNSSTLGSVDQVETSTTIIYAGGMPYDVLLNIPFILVKHSSSDLRSGGIYVTVDGDRTTLDFAISGSTENRRDGLSTSGQFSTTIPAGKVDTIISITGYTSGSGRTEVRLTDCLIVANKKNSSSFKEK